MPQKNKVEHFPSLLAGLLFLSAGILRLLLPPENPAHIFAFIYGNLVYFGIIFCWGIYVERSILSQKIRRLMLILVGFMIFYMLVGACKHRIFLGGQFAGRFTWYLYYVPQVFATLLTFVIAFRVGKPEEYKLPKLFYLFFAAGVLMVVGYLTNDMHQLAFRFNLDFVAWDVDYDWGPLFIASTLWIYLWLIAGVGILTVKCRAVNRKKAWIPVFWLLLGSVYIIYANFLHTSGVNPFNLPETHCFIVIAMLESSIRLGLMPSNSSYGEIVSNSSAAFQIADYNNKVIYCSDNAVALSPAQMEQATQRDVLIDKNTVLKANTVSGGNIFWTKDITEINRMNERLGEIGRSLSEEGDLLKAENEIKEQRAQIAEQTRLYDSIYEFVRPQLDKISRLVEGEGDFNKNMAHICILNCYVKRRANLTLLQYKAPFFSSEELYLSLKESAEYLKLYGVVSEVYADKREQIDAYAALLCFDLWQTVIEEAISDMYAVMAEIRFDESKLIFKITVDTPQGLNCFGKIESRVKEADGILETISEDETTFITLTIRKGGERI